MLGQRYNIYFWKLFKSHQCNKFCFLIWRPACAREYCNQNEACLWEDTAWVIIQTGYGWIQHREHYWPWKRRSFSSDMRCHLRNTTPQVRWVVSHLKRELQQCSNDTLLSGTVITWHDHIITTDVITSLKKNKRTRGAFFWDKSKLHA